MPTYTISDLEKMTGIKAHTLRAWEQRYGIVAPRRTETNIRYYVDEDLRKLLNVALLNRQGLRISRIAGMSEQERSEHLARSSALNVSGEVKLDALTLSILELDASRFDHIVRANIDQRGFEETMLEVVYPFLNKLNLLYFTGSVSTLQELFVGNLIRQKVLAATEALPTPPAGRPSRTFALYLPPGEQQDLSLLFMQYLLVKRGLRVIYLGRDVAPELLGEAHRLAEFDYLLTVIHNTFVRQTVAEHLEEVLCQCPRSTVFVTGRQLPLEREELDPRIRAVSGLQALRDVLDRLPG